MKKGPIIASNGAPSLETTTALTSASIVQGLSLVMAAPAATWRTIMVRKEGQNDGSILWKLYAKPGELGSITTEVTKLRRAGEDGKYFNFQDAGATVPAPSSLSTFGVLFHPVDDTRLPRSNIEGIVSKVLDDEAGGAVLFDRDTTDNPNGDIYIQSVAGAANWDAIAAGMSLLYTVTTDVPGDTGPDPIAGNFR